MSYHCSACQKEHATEEICPVRGSSLISTHDLPPDVKQQAHYTVLKIQPVTFITANKLSYNQGNVIKYVCRYPYKDGLKDLLKARNYIDYLIQELETGEVKP